MTEKILPLIKRLIDKTPGWGLGTMVIVIGFGIATGMAIVLSCYGLSLLK